MAKDKKPGKKLHEHEHQVYQAGDKYHCIECGAEVAFGNDCPECKAKINWQQIEGMAHRM